MSTRWNPQSRLPRRRPNATQSPTSPAQERRRAAQADINRQLNRWPPRRIAAWTLFVLGGLIAGQHILAHLGVRPLPLTMGWQDLLVGYPTALLVVIVGAIVLEPRRAK